MKIAVSATGNSLESDVDPRFGRCLYFLIIETDTLKFDAFENFNISLGGGAGIQSAQFIAEKGVRYLLTGNCGPNAYQTLSAANIGIITGCSGKVRDVVERFRAGGEHISQGPNVQSHFGMGAGFAGGRGMGGGRGAGRGMGMGRGGNPGMGAGFGGAAGMPSGGRGMQTPPVGEEDPDK